MSRYKCEADGCGQQLDFEVLIASEIWERIAKGRYALCPRCIDAECVLLGLKEVECTAIYVGKALRSKLDLKSVAAVHAWRPSQMCVARGTIGNPVLYEVNK